MARRLVAYISPWCPTCRDTQRALAEWNVPCTYINIQQDCQAADRVRQWTGFESVPTLVIAEADSLEPFEPPSPLAPGASPRGKDRGAMITEASRSQVRAWLIKHELLAG